MQIFIVGPERTIRQVNYVTENTSWLLCYMFVDNLRLSQEWLELEIGLDQFV